MCKCCSASWWPKQLRSRVLIAAIGTIIIASIIFLTSFIYIMKTKHSYPFNSNPLRATFFLIGLVTMCLSLYEMLLSASLIFFLRRQQDNLFIMSMWYVSHLSLIVIYIGCIIMAMVVATWRHHAAVFLTSSVFGCFIVGPIIYFAIVVNTYLHSSDQDRYF